MENFKERRVGLTTNYYFIIIFEKKIDWLKLLHFYFIEIKSLNSVISYTICRRCESEKIRKGQIKNVKKKRTGMEEIKKVRKREKKAIRKERKQEKKWESDTLREIIM
jgi:hypothetical protein